MLSIQFSKTDQFREGASLVVGRTGVSTCLVVMLERYFRMGGLSFGSHDKVRLGQLCTPRKMKGCVRQVD